MANSTLVLLADRMKTLVSILWDVDVIGRDDTNLFVTDLCLALSMILFTGCYMLWIHMVITM